MVERRIVVGDDRERRFRLVVRLLIRFRRLRPDRYDRRFPPVKREREPLLRMKHPGQDRGGLAAKDCFIRHTGAAAVDALHDARAVKRIDGRCARITLRNIRNAAVFHTVLRLQPHAPCSRICNRAGEHVHEIRACDRTLPVEIAADDCVVLRVCGIGLIPGRPGLKNRRFVLGQPVDARGQLDGLRAGQTALRFIPGLRAAVEQSALHRHTDILVKPCGFRNIRERKPLCRGGNRKKSEHQGQAYDKGSRSPEVIVHRFLHSFLCACFRGAEACVTFFRVFRIIAGPISPPDAPQTSRGAVLPAESRQTAARRRA